MIKSMLRYLPLAAAAAAVTMLASSRAQADELRVSERIYRGQSLNADSCYYHMDLQMDGNLVVYADSTALWSTGTTTGYYATMLTDGNFALYDVNDNQIWSASTFNNSSWGNNFVSMQDDGNLVVYNGLTQQLWDTDTIGALIGQTCSRITTKTIAYSTTNYSGSTFSTVLGLSNYNVCAQRCSSNLSCKAFTFIPPNGATSSRCQLKSSIPSATFIAGYISGSVSRI